MKASSSHNLSTPHSAPPIIHPASRAVLLPRLSITGSLCCFILYFLSLVFRSQAFGVLSPRVFLWFKITFSSHAVALGSTFHAQKNWMIVRAVVASQSPLCLHPHLSLQQTTLAIRQIKIQSCHLLQVCDTHRERRVGIGYWREGDRNDQNNFL